MRKAPALWFAAFFVLGLAATFPMRVAAGWAGGGVTARDAEGTIWAGRVLDLRLAGLALGSPDAVVLPLSFPGGEPLLSLKWKGEEGLSGRASVSSRGLGIDRLTGVIDAGGASSLPLAALSLQDFSVGARGGRCGHAAGIVKAALSDGSPGPLVGTPRCAGRAMVLPLRGQGRALNLRISGSAFAAELRGPAGVIARAGGPLRQSGD